MLLGKRFFPLTGIPMWKSARMRIRFADWLPEPLAVATWMLKSLTTACGVTEFALGGIDGRVRFSREAWQPGSRGRPRTRGLSSRETGARTCGRAADYRRCPAGSQGEAGHHVTFIGRPRRGP